MNWIVEGQSIESMGRIAGPRARRAGTWLLVLAVVAALYAATIGWVGGFDETIGPIRLRSRDATRPAILAGLAFVLFLILDHRRAVNGAAASWTGLQSRRASGLVLAVALLWTAVAGLWFNTRAAGGADSYGYVSQVQLLRRGDLVDRVPDDPSFDWQDARESLVPLGYVPTDAPGVIAPLYPPGLPLLMLPASLLAADGVYVVVPLFGLLLIAGVWMAGVRLGDPLAGGIAAVLVASNGTFIYQLVQPMSDVPAAACWLVALLVVGHSRAGDLTSGLFTGLAILIRPNLAPLALVVFTAGRLPARWTAGRLLRWGSPIAAGVLALLYVQFVRYGSPWASGYGSLAELFSLEFVATNLRQYPAWTTAVCTPLIWLSLAGPFLVPAREARPFGWILFMLAAAVWTLYLPYVAFQPHEWHYTRFLLPALAVMVLLTTVVLLRGIRLLPLPLRTVVMVALVAALVVVMGRYAATNGAFGIRFGEQKYEATGRSVTSLAGPGAWVLAAQHSGSLRYYAGSHTVRWDLVRPADVDRVVEILSARRRPVLLVLDPGEVEVFRERFAGSQAVGRMVLAGIAADTRIYRFE